MKKIYTGVLLCLAIVASSCSDWLDVTPRTQITSKDLFKSEIGFKSAHIGVYLQLTDKKLYGRDVNMLFTESICRNWTSRLGGSGSEILKKRQLIYDVSNFNFQEAQVEKMISDIWLTYYFSIAQLNEILENLNSTKTSFTYDNDLLIKGEALGLRAFLHLELLRLYGSVPGQGNMGVPYVTKMSKEIDGKTSLPFDEVVTLIEKDLTEAEELLKDLDLIGKYTNKELDNLKAYFGDLNYDEWQTKRQGRFNYYAVLGTKARLYNWIGDKENAVRYAKMVIDAKNKDNTPKFPLATLTTFKNHVFYDEHLFGLHNPKLVSELNDEYASSDCYLTQSKTLTSSAYQLTVHPLDFRYNNSSEMWRETQHQGSTQNHFRKYIGTEQYTSALRVPLLRVSEMYLILVENSEFTAAKEYFRIFALARSLTLSEFLASITDEQTLKAVLEKEYRKEFFGEGQMFFFYKRNNYTKYTWPAVAELPKNLFVIAKPKGQINFE